MCATVFSKIAVNISIFHLGSYTWRTCIAPRRGAVGPTHCQSHSPPGLSCEFTLIKAQLFALNTAAERGTSDETEATAITRTTSGEG